ncbi:hypothetical protein [Cupriavidus sp. IK-TO18]|uniref:hypothetical protein n=1 Tax=Cupriavidus sp. IK-TO18 TaxID=2782182 RepID=UPI001898BB51|nr:hypothetical protein [Cupriavidus sp. IK-TO18]MBF6992325.1 hypothetical protein [Cupriavidus sp. IK-TO18]
MPDRLLALVRALEAHQVRNPENCPWLTDDRFLASTDGKTVDLVDAIDAEARAVLCNGDGTANPHVLLALRNLIDVGEGQDPHDPAMAAVIISCAHGRLAIPIFSSELSLGKLRS